MATKNHKYNQGFFKGGFIRMPMHLLTMPGIDKLIDKKGVHGLGLYLMINLELSNSATHWGSLEKRQVSALAQKARMRSREVLSIINDYGLFMIDGGRYTTPWMVEQFNMNVANMPQTDTTPACTYNTRTQDIEKDTQKENKEKGSVRVSDDTHLPSDKDAHPLSPSGEETETCNYKSFNHYLKRK